MPDLSDLDLIALPGMAAALAARDIAAVYRLRMLLAPRAEVPGQPSLSPNGQIVV